MTIEEIKELLKIFNESGVGEMELQRGKDRLRIRRSCSGPAERVTPVRDAGHATAAASTRRAAVASAAHRSESQSRRPIRCW